MQTTNLKQQQLTFDKGITNVPSDAICSDNTLEESIGLVYENGEHRVIQQPKQLFSEIASSIDGPIVFVHNLPTGRKNYIFFDNHSSPWFFSTDAVGNLIPFSEDEDDYTRQLDQVQFASVDRQKIQAVGKTLIIAHENGLRYYLWKAENSDYKSLGTTIPRPRMEFALKNDIGSVVTAASTQSTLKYVASNDTAVDGVDIDYDITDKELFNNSAHGAYAAGKKLVAKKKGFCLPFMVRYALQMYDGEYIHISNPVPMFPCVSDNHFLRPGALYMLPMSLHYKNRTEYSDWSDIIKKISVFVSAGVEMYNLGKEAAIYGHGEHNERESDGIFNTGTYTAEAGDILRMFLFERKENTELDDDLMATSVFYHLCDIKSSELVTADWQDMGRHFRYDTLENLTTREQLKYDNYYSLAPLSADFLFTYNNRLNLAKAKRGFFEGFEQFSGLQATSYATYTFYVRIASENGSRVVKNTVRNNFLQGYYFFYPDARAVQVTCYKLVQGEQVLQFNAGLEEHPGLNGAYCFEGWWVPQGAGGERGLPQTQYEPLTDADLDTTPETLDSYIITSEVNNPFLVKAEGYNMVGDGSVIGMSTLTTALSQGQFGQYPLLVFTTEGIWAMSVSNTGLFNAILPMSREVCNNPASITQTDGEVFFSSKKGLMVIVGSQVKCVSEQLSGRVKAYNIDLSFAEYLKQSFMAYDYRDSLLWIFNPNSGFEEFCYVYSIRSGTFSKYQFQNAVTNVVSDYPDYLLQSNREEVLSLLNRPDINSSEEQANSYSATLITRPMKLENAFALKRLIQVLHVRQFDEAKLSLRIFASNNLRPETSTWVELHSLRGTPWKYYRFRYDFTSLKATDRFAGTVLVTREERTDKLR